MTEPIRILRKGVVSDGAGGQLETEDQVLFSGMAEQKPQLGERTSEGFKPFLTIRRKFSFYRPWDLVVLVGDVVLYRNARYAVLSLPVESEDRKRVTLYTELVTV